MRSFSATALGSCSFLFLCLLFFGGCNTSLGPGYTIEKQNFDLHFVSNPDPHLTVRCTYQLVNSGSQPLTSIRIVVPPAKSFHRSSTAAEWNGQSIAIENISTAAESDPGDTVELRWTDPWVPKQKRTLILNYDLSTGFHLAAFLAVGPETFFAYPRSWDPTLLPPKGIFTAGGIPPKDWAISVRVPSGFLVHASGTPLKRFTDHDEWIYSFEQQLRDFAPFAAGGKYLEKEIRSDGERIIFWALEPVDPAAAQKAAASIASRVRYYQKEYGNRARGDRAIHLLECFIPNQSFGCGALPETVFVQQAWIARGLKDKEFYNDANFEIAYTWFGGVARMRFDEYPLPMDAIAPYAGWEAQAMEEGAGARASRIRWLISDFDKHAASCKEKIILPRPAGRQDCSYPAAWSKSGLFVFAIEDKIGRANLHKALKYMIQARRGQDFALEDLISAIESETHQPQREFVRKWLKHAGIPEDFRARYSVAVAPAANSLEEAKP